MYTRSEILDAINISEVELNLFQGLASVVQSFTDDDLIHIDEARSAAIESNQSISDYLRSNPSSAVLPSAKQQSNGSRQSNTSHNATGNMPGSFQEAFAGIRSDSIQPQAIASKTNTDSANKAALGMAAAMMGSTILEAARLYPTLLEDTLNGRFSDNPEIYAMQVAALAPLAQMQEAMEQDFLEQFKNIYLAPQPTKEEMYDRMGKNLHTMFHRDRNQPLSILGVEKTQPQLNAAQ